MRHRNTNRQCPVCNEETETILHVLVTCSAVRANHQLISSTEVVEEYNSFAEWLWLIFDQKNQKETQLQVMVRWMIWKNRNDLVWNQHCMAPTEVVNSAFSSLNQWKVVQDKIFDQFMGFLTPEDGVEQWHPPAPSERQC